jgi:hypothetical protein
MTLTLIDFSVAVSVGPHSSAKGEDPGDLMIQTRACIEKTMRVEIKYIK